MIGRNSAGASQGRHQVGGKIERPQPWIERPQPKRRLINGSGKAARCERGERADIAWPGHAEVFACRASRTSDGDKPAEPGKLPVERACKPRRAIFLSRERRAAPLIGAIEKPGAWK